MVAGPRVTHSDFKLRHYQTGARLEASAAELANYLS